MVGQQQVKLFKYFVPITSLWARFYFGRGEERKDLLNISIMADFGWMAFLKQGAFPTKHFHRYFYKLLFTSGSLLTVQHISY